MSGEPFFGQPLVIEAVAVEKMILQDGGRPDAELGAALRLDPVADGDDDIEVVKSGGFVRICNMDFLHIAFFLQFPVLEDIPEMAGDNRLISLEKLHHLRLGEPDRLLPQMDFEQTFPVFSLINDYFPLLILHAAPRCRRFTRSPGVWSFAFSSKRVLRGLKFFHGFLAGRQI
jgi:hypothetical protein